MYEPLFGFRERPFAAAPSPQRYYAAASIESARAALTRCVQRAEGTAIVIGPSGTGKTLLCQVIMEQFKDEFVTALLSSGRLCTRRALLQAISFELGLPYRGLEEGELRLALLDRIASPRDAKAGLVLVVDESHTLPWRLLEELRLLSNLIRDGQPRVRLVLAGGPQLEDRFASPKLDSFNQRLAARCYLTSLEREETFAYARYQISAAGGNPDLIFAADALQSIYRATDGIPRLINQVCDHALVLCAAGGQRQVTAAAVEEAWADLQQLPTPFTGTEPREGSSAVEFGALDDSPAESPEAIPFRSAVDSREFAMAGPTEKLDQIQEQLAHLDDDFQPAGSIGPEVELVFHETVDPFGERFEQEEVVLDRIAPLEKILDRRPIVSSREGRELAQMLAPYSASGGQRPSPDRPGQTVPLRSQTQAQEPNDDDLIIVEEDPPQGIEAGATTPAPLVRRQEYRQLFAKLRRG